MTAPNQPAEPQPFAPQPNYNPNPNPIPNYPPPPPAPVAPPPPPTAPVAPPAPVGQPTPNYMPPPTGAPVVPIAHTQPTPQRDIIVTTGNDIPGHDIDQILGMCWGITVRSMGTVRGVTASVRSFVRTELPEMTRTMDEARHDAENRLIESARALGANAVIAVRFDSTSNGFSEITAYGTAVVARKHDNS